MEQRKYPQAMLDVMKEKQTVIREDGLDVLVKPIPDEDRPGMLDPRFYAGMAPMMKGPKGAIVRLMMKMNSKKKMDVQKAAENMRNMMNGVKSIPVVEGVNVKQDEVQSDGVRIPIRIYTPGAQSAELQPVFYYIHGGGFVAGSMDVVDEMCKMVVAKTGCAAVQVGYRLAPEHPYPAGLDDCYAVLQWIGKNAASFGGDAQRICISGDSAGGNLATVCAMRDRDDGVHLIKAQALLYPTVDAAHMQENGQANRRVYEIAEDQKKMMNRLFDMMGGMLGGASMGEYLGAPDDTQPYISPSLGDLKGMPPAIILLGEYDFLRVENDVYAHKLQRAGVEVTLVRYRGLSHGFADQVGVTPQAEDALEEIGAFMMAHLGKKQGGEGSGA